MIDVSEPDVQEYHATLEWEVVDLLLSDELLVREMFEAIVSTEWSPTPIAPPRNPPGVGAGTAGVEKPPPPDRSAGFRARRQGQRPGPAGWARERSPPNHQQPERPAAQRTRPQ